VLAGTSGADPAADRTTGGVRRGSAAPTSAPQQRRAPARLGLTRRGQAAADAAGPASAGEANVVARLVNLDPGLFAFSVTGATRWPGMAPGLGVPAVHLASVHAAEDAALEITTATGGPGMWLGGRSTTLLVRAPARGGTALVTAYLGHDPAATTLALTIRRVDAATEPPVRTVSFAARTESASAPEIPLEIVLHIRGRGDVYFFGSDWAGRDRGSRRSPSCRAMNA